jgi:predicted nucleic acid binding AN1-type Zn finger protein
MCKKKCGLLAMECKGCKKEFCSTHRLPEDHGCECMEKYKQGLKEQLKDCMMKQQYDLKEMAQKNNFVRMS